MAVVILAARFSDRRIVPHLGPLGSEAYPVVRGALISLAMASLIAWLAFRHKWDYEKKLTEHNEALESTRDFLSRIIEGSAEAIVTLDPAGRVTSWNRAAEEIFGWKAEEMLGTDLKRLLPADPAAAEDLAEMEAIVRSGRPVREYEVNRVRKDGRRITVRITLSPLYDGDGDYLGSTGIVRDVTAFKEMEARLVERERLAAVGELAASVAHEIKNPLAGIRGACEILSDVFSEDDPRRELSEEVHRQIERLDRTLRDLLRFAKPQAMRQEATDIHAVLDRVLAVLLEADQARSITVDRDYDRAMPELRVDPQQMEQVFINILLNAFQAMNHAGKIVIRTIADGEGASISIRDSGPGIPPEVADRIFKPFFTTRSKGTGLGLAIVKNIVTAHGGAISAATAPGGGAEFTITLPKGA